MSFVQFTVQNKIWFVVPYITNLFLFVLQMNRGRLIVRRLQVEWLAVGCFCFVLDTPFFVVQPKLAF